VLLHPRHRDRLDAARRPAHGQIRRDSPGRHCQLPRAQALSRAYLLGSGLGAGADRAARSREPADGGGGDGKEAARRDSAVEHGDEALGRQRMSPPRIIRLGAPPPAPETGRPSQALAGDPLTTTHDYFTDSTGQFFCGIWESTPGMWRCDYTESEFVYLISGR